MNCALTIYPLSARFRSGLEERLGGPVTYLSIQELRALSPAAAFMRLRRLDAVKLLLPIEDEGSRPTLGLVTAIAAVAKAQQVEIVGPDLSGVSVTPWQLVAALARIAGASMRSIWAAMGTLLRLARINAQARIPAALEPRGQTLYLNANLWFGVKAGGSIGHVAGVANELHRQGLDVVLASAGGRGMVRADVPIIDLAAPRVFGLPYELNYYLFGRMAESQLRGLTPSPGRFIYQRMSVGNFTGVQLSRAWGLPLVLEYNGSEVWVSRHWGKRLRFERLAIQAEEACLRHAHLIVTVSDVLKDELIRRGVESRRIVSYPNCIDPETFNPAVWVEPATRLRANLAIPMHDCVVAFLGTFGQWHGAEVLARAIRTLVDQRADWLMARRLRFVLVGDGLKMPEVRHILGADACSRFVTLTGLVPQEEAPAYLQMADIVVSPHVPNADGSAFFGSPTKLFEYMAMGKAIVASDLDQIGGVLRNSVRGDSLPGAMPESAAAQVALLVAPGSEEELVRGLQFLVEHPEWRQVLGANARAEALARYTWTHHVDAIMSGLRSVTATRLGVAA